ncbi:MAG: FAD-binding oxidoreductase, partial [Rhodobiaceae bacterium]|nr:FAD-binding oxidoreductase [Rhodobiaceae bacterium]
MAAHVDSYYAATANPLDPFAPLDGDRRADVCVVGGGFTGLSTALHLAEAGVDVCLIEANAVGWGASGRNGGQVGSGQRLWQTELEPLVGMDDAKALWRIGEDAKHLVLDLIERHGIACDLAHGILCPVHKQRYEAEYHAYARHLNDVYDYDKAVPLSADEMRDKLKASGYFGGYLDKGGPHIHPLDFARGLADAARKAGAAIHEDTRATRIVPGAAPKVETVRGTITADHVVIACNGYLDGLFPAVDNRLFPINNFVVATAPMTPDEQAALIADRLAVADSRFVVYYYRFSGDRRLIFGGGETYSHAFPA